MEGNSPDETRPGFTEETAIASLGTAGRHKFSLRGHMILDIDDPLPVADTPADPPPIAPISTIGQPPLGI
jgi:hypothetical protein